MNVLIVRFWVSFFILRPFLFLFLLQIKVEATKLCYRLPCGKSYERNTRLMALKLTLWSDEESSFTCLRTCLRLYIVWFSPNALSLNFPHLSLKSGQVCEKNNSHQTIWQQNWQVGVVMVIVTIGTQSVGRIKEAHFTIFPLSRWSIESELTLLSRSRKLKEWNIHIKAAAYP